MLTLSTSASIFGTIGQQEGDAAVDRTISYGQKNRQDLSDHVRCMMCAARALTTQKRYKACREGSWEGVGSLVAGGDSVLPCQGHDWSWWWKSCHRCRLFLLIVAGFLPQGARDSRFRLHSGRRKWCPCATTSLNPLKRSMNIANSSPRGPI